MNKAVIILLVLSVCCAGFTSAEETSTKKGARMKFEDRVRVAVESGEITKEEGADLLMMHKNLKKMKDDIWADGKMTVEEREKFKDASKEFRRRRKQLLKEVKKSRREKKFLAEPYRGKSDAEKPAMPPQK